MCAAVGQCVQKAREFRGRDRTSVTAATTCSARLETRSASRFNSSGCVMDDRQAAIPMMQITCRPGHCCPSGAGGMAESSDYVGILYAIWCAICPTLRSLHYKDRRSSIYGCERRELPGRPFAGSSITISGPINLVRDREQDSYKLVLLFGLVFVCGRLIFHYLRHLKKALAMDSPVFSSFPFSLPRSLTTCTEIAFPASVWETGTRVDS